MSRSVIRCINCELRLTRTRRRLSNENEEIVNIIRLWTYPREITDTDFVCQACWDLANHASEQALEHERQVGHQSVCVGCGRSILRSRSRVVLRPDSTVEERQLADIISQWIRHRQLTPTDEACGPCWLRAQRILRRNTGTQSAQPNLLANQVIISELEVENPVEQEETQTIPEQQYITLPNIRRAADTRRHCLFSGCRNPERFHIPDIVRRRVLSDCNFYIPRGSRICSYHMGRNIFQDLYTSENSLSNFNTYYIEDMIFILAEPVNVFNFEDIQSLPEYLVHYFLGISLFQHQQILNETQSLQEMHRGSFALTALLCKLRTGDSGDRLSCLFQTPRRTVETLMDKARDILFQEYVPQHLGLQHISRNDVITKNSRNARKMLGSHAHEWRQHYLESLCPG